MELKRCKNSAVYLIAVPNVHMVPVHSSTSQICTVLSLLSLLLLFSLFHIFHLTLLAFRGRQRKNVIVQRHMLLTVAMTINTVNPDRNPETNHSTVKHGWDLAGFIVTDLDPR